MEAGIAPLRVTENDWQLKFPDGLSRANIRLINTTIDVTAEDGGNLSVYGDNVEIAGRSRLLMGIDQNLGFEGAQAGKFLIEAQGKVVAREGSRLANDVRRGGTGTGGDLRIVAAEVEIRDGTQLSASTFGLGNAGNVLITAGDRVFFQGTNGQFSSAAFSNVESGGEGKGGNVMIDTPILEVRDGAQLGASTRGKGDAGNVQITAGDRIFFQDGSAFSSVEAGGEGKGGNVMIEAPMLEVRDGAQLVSSTRGQGDAGNVLITVDDRILFENGAVASTVEAGAIGNGGEIRVTGKSLSLLNAGQLLSIVQASQDDKPAGLGNAGQIIVNITDDIEIIGRSQTLRSQINSGTGEGTTGNAGDILIQAGRLRVAEQAQIDGATSGTGDAGNLLIDVQGEVIFDNGFASSFVEDTGEGQGGDIRIQAGSLEVKNGGQLQAVTLGRGDAGNVILEVGDRVLFKNGGAFSSVEIGGEGKGGNVLIEAPILEVRDRALLSASTSGTGNAGNVQITAGEHVLFQNGGAISSVRIGGEGKGGDVLIEAPILEVRNRALLSASTSGTGNAGNVQIMAGERVLFQNGNAITRVATGGKGRGGNVVIEAPILEVRDGAALLANTRGTGNAGNVQIMASDRVLFQNGSAFSSVEADGKGKGGNVVIEAPILEVRDGAALLANTLGAGDAGDVLITADNRILLDNTNPTDGCSSGIFTVNGTPSTSNISTGQGGNVILTTPRLTVSNGAVIDSRTVNDQPGGNITLNLNNLALLGGGQILTTSNGSGPAGNILLTATDQITISGTDPTYAARRAANGTRVAPTSEFSALSVRSNSTGSAGDIILNTPNLTLTDGGQIIAESATGNGGNLFIGTKPSAPAFVDRQVISPDTILLRNGSLISATAGDRQNPGNGGNITIDADLLIGLPNENSDIIANAFEGTGGNITINADAILNFDLQAEPDVDRLRSNRTNDISASSQSGNSGTLNLAGLNVDPSQGTTQLPTNLTDPSNQISSQCAAPTLAQSEFVITGRSGLPQSPNEPLEASASPSAWVALPATNIAHTNQPAPNPEPVVPLAEATHWQANNGTIQLIAARPQPIETASTVACANHLLSQQESP